ncbi:potassium channel family protein [Candidatus Cetobacterium colombiensis]|uniref:Potassium channel family protein n=1 Tax=Candidatus Cetobacterium colombiensis TaxID=3073100 RepID=A0ABU4W7S9_9FUSO|nr:potassium channel family protein [Candidatus Cetobacterium colombiensis]MDX8335092.1 potassium channel family protein [Candidatus Cetobacterium colombiensis]
MINYKLIFSNLINSIKNLKGTIKINDFKRTKIRTFSLVLSIFFTGWELYNSNTINSSRQFIFSSIIMVVSMYFILYPFIYFFRPKFKKFLSDHAIFSIFLIVYFILLIPILGGIDYLFLNIFLGSFIIKFLHIISILVSMSLIIIIVSKQFIMLINKKRQIKGLDILTTFLTYITLGLAFGSFYYILNLMAQNNLFIGIEKPTSTFNFENFLNHLYISLGSLTTVGSGSISPLNAYIRLLCVLETMLGIFLTSFSLGFIFSALGATLPASQTENNDAIDTPEVVTNIPSKKFPFFWGTIKFIKKINSDLNEIENSI